MPAHLQGPGSGASTDWPGLKECLGYLRKGDVLVVLDLDCLGQPAGELVQLVDKLRASAAWHARKNLA